MFVCDESGHWYTINVLESGFLLKAQGVPGNAYSSTNSLIGVRILFGTMKTQHRCFR